MDEKMILWMQFIFTYNFNLAKQDDDIYRKYYTETSTQDI